MKTETDADPFAEVRSTIAAIHLQNREQGRPTNAVSGHTASDWLERAVGLFTESEAFEEAAHSGEAWRNAALDVRDDMARRIDPKFPSQLNSAFRGDLYLGQRLPDQVLFFGGIEATPK